MKIPGYSDSPGVHYPPDARQELTVRGDIDADELDKLSLMAATKADIVLPLPPNHNRWYGRLTGRCMGLDRLGPTNDGAGETVLITLHVKAYDIWYK